MSFQNHNEFLDWFSGLDEQDQQDIENHVSSQDIDKSIPPGVSKQIAAEFYGKGQQNISTTPSSIGLGIKVPQIDLRGKFEHFKSSIIYSGPRRNFMISYKLSCDTTTTSRSTHSAELYLNDEPVPRTRSYSYHRTVDDGKDTATSSNILNLKRNDKIEIKSKEESSNDNVVVLLDYSTISFVEILGSKSR